MTTTFLLITINPNFSLISHTNAENADFRDEMKQILDNLMKRETILSMFSYPARSKMQTLRITPRFEVSPRYKHLHAHLFLELKADDAKLARIDIPKLRTYLNDAFGHKIHLNVRRLNQAESEIRMNALNYIGKAVDGYTPIDD